MSFSRLLTGELRRIQFPIGGIGVWVKILGIAVLLPVAAMGQTIDRDAKLVPNQMDVDFGFSVAVSGDRALIGGESSAYIFERDSSGDWSQEAELTATGLSSPSVDLAGTRAVVGAGMFAEEAAYVFEPNGGGAWSEVAELTPSDGNPFDSFGSSVAISEDGQTIAVGSPFHDFFGSADGAVYIFERDGSGNWMETAKLIGSTVTSGEFFSIGGISLSGDTLLVGNPGDGDSIIEPGSAFVFQRDASGNWNEVAELTASNGFDRDGFGSSVSIDGNHAIVLGDRGNWGLLETVYLFEADGSGSWNEVDDFSDANGFRGVAIEDNLAIGTRFNDAALFERDGSGNWSETATLIASDAGIVFFKAASIDGGRALIGAPDQQAIQGGEAFVYDLDVTSPGPELTVNWPEEGSTWRLEDNTFIIETSNGVGTFGPVFGDPETFGFVFGPIVFDLSPASAAGNAVDLPRFAFGFAVIVGGELNGVVVQFAIPPVVPISGSLN